VGGPREKNHLKKTAKAGARSAGRKNKRTVKTPARKGYSKKRQVGGSQVVRKRRKMEKDCWSKKEEKK